MTTKTYDVVLLIAIILLLALCLYSSYKENEILVEARKADIAQLEEVIVNLREMIRRDDLILNQMMHGTWDRSCEYELVPDELLADGSIRSSMIQHCDKEDK